MNVLVVNPIIYTAETKDIKRADTVKDTMIYDLCLGFVEKGHEVVLYAAEPFKPLSQETYPFKIIWGKCSFQQVCQPHRFPYMPKLYEYIKEHRDIDLIISSEVFSLNTLSAVRAANKKVVIWHELSKHNAFLYKLPSKIWYHVIPRLFMRNTKVVARSEEARNFISQFCKGTLSLFIDHGVNLNKFVASERKENYFVVCSQLIDRKRIDGILCNFKNYLVLCNSQARLYVIGDGEKKAELEELSHRLQISDQVIFTGKMTHGQLLPILSHASALLVNTEKDNSMISIVESIAVGTPVITTEVPLNASYIKEFQLGIAENWDYRALKEIVDNNLFYVRNCLNYRERLSTYHKVEQFVEVMEMETKGGESKGKCIK